MKKFAFQLLCLSILSPLFALAADTNPPPRLTIELRDGSRVVGTSLAEKMNFHSSLLGDLKLDVKAIRSVECATTNAAKLTTANGDTLTVSFADSALVVKTGFGKVKLAVDSIRKLSVSAPVGAGGHRVGLVALWLGDGNANDSVGECNGRLFGNVGYAQGLSGQAFDLNPIARRGDGEYSSGFRSGPPFVRGNGFVQIPAGPALNVGAGDGFTIEGWIKPATTSRAMAIAEYERSLGTYDGADVGVQLYVSQPSPAGAMPGALMVNLVDAEQASHSFTSPVGTVTAGVWQHVALTYDKSSGTAALYANGIVVGQTNPGRFTPQTGFANLILGARTTFGSVTSPRDAFSGQMAEIAIFNRALSPEEIRGDYEVAKQN